MNLHLQHKFEQELFNNRIVNDRRLFNKDKKGVYTSEVVFFMYRVWVMKQAEIETLNEKYEKQLEEMFMCGYTDCEYDFSLKLKEKTNEI